MSLSKNIKTNPEIGEIFKIKRDSQTFYVFSEEKSVWGDKKITFLSPISVVPETLVLIIDFLLYQNAPVVKLLLLSKNSKEQKIIYWIPPSFKILIKGIKTKMDFFKKDVFFASWFLTFKQVG